MMKFPSRNVATQKLVTPVSACGTVSVTSVFANATIYKKHFHHITPGTTISMLKAYHMVKYVRRMNFVLEVKGRLEKLVDE